MLLKSIKFIVGFLLLSIAAGSAGQVKLPIDNSWPLIYDNDSYEDVYSMEVAFLMAHAGVIDLQGVIHTNGGWRDPWDLTDFIWKYNISHAQELVEMSRRSGLTGIPDVALGVVHPIVDKAENSAGANLILDIVRKSETPVMLVAGGPVSTLADAWLMDHSIADKVVVLWLGFQNWNGFADEFQGSVDIVLKNFKCLFFLSYRGYAPVFTKSMFVNLPHTELTQFMVEKELPHVPLPEMILLDGLPLVPLLTDEFVTEANRYDYGGRDKEGDVILIANPEGKLYDIVHADPVKGTEAVWGLMNNCSLYGQSPFKTGSSPYFGEASIIPCTIEAEHFDHGGQGFGYFDTHFKSWSNTKEYNITTFRPVTHVDFKEFSKDGSTNYAVSRTQTCEWLNYKIEALEEGVFDVSVRVQPIDAVNHITQEVGSKVSLRILLNGKDVTGILALPLKPDQDPEKWEELSFKGIKVTKGVHDLRIFIHHGNMSIDNFTISRSNL